MITTSNESKKEEGKSQSISKNRIKGKNLELITEISTNEMNICEFKNESQKWTVERMMMEIENYEEEPMHECGMTAIEPSEQEEDE